MNKKITHKEHRQLLSELYKKQGGRWIYQADAYIKQQEKQEKLLEFYKELANLRDEMLDTCEIVNDDYYDIRKKETNLEKQIEELENEKEEVK